MTTFPTNPALEAAIIAHVEEDTPRLAYADWLDENDAPARAEFIRVQVRLATSMAADPEYPDLVERYSELVAQFHQTAKLTVPELPPGFEFDERIDFIFDNFRRGFLYTVSPKWFGTYTQPTDADVEEFRTGIPQLMATTTARKFTLVHEPVDEKARILSAPSAEKLTGLRIAAQDDDDTLARVVAEAACAPNLGRLDFAATLSATGMRALADAKFDRLTQFDLSNLRGNARDAAVLMRAKWFRGLRSVEKRILDDTDRPLVTGLGQLPHLESLWIELNRPAAIDRLSARGAFPSLSQLFFYGMKWNKSNTVKFAKAKFPRLTHLRMPDVNNEAFQNLLRAPWFPQLRVLDLHSGPTSDASLIPLSKSEAAANLRVLNLNDGKWRKGGVLALADGARFPNLTTLDIGTAYSTATTPEIALTFVKALSLPRLRHLNLRYWPLGEEGAKALAANPAVANLTRLTLAHCDIGEKGLTAIARSPHLQGLIELDVEFNELKKAGALLDTSLLPRLALAKLDFNNISVAARKKLNAARGWVAFFEMDPS